MRHLPGAILSLAAVVALTACGGPPAPVPTPPPGAVVVTAQGTAFVGGPVTAPAGVAFTLFFENRDNEPHNVRILDASNLSVATTEIFTGPGARTIDVAALPVGTYRLLCDIHPGMTAELTLP